MGVNETMSQAFSGVYGLLYHEHPDVGRICSNMLHKKEKMPVSDIPHGKLVNVKLVS